MSSIFGIWAGFGFVEGASGGGSAAESLPVRDDGVEFPEGGSVKTGGVADFHLSDDDFSRIKTTLTPLPRNLKLIVEEQIGERNFRVINCSNSSMSWWRGDRLKR